MSEATIKELFRNLERTLHERLQCIEEVILKRGASGAAAAVATAASPEIESLRIISEQHALALNRLNSTVEGLVATVETLRAKVSATELLPTRPLEGLELVPKREVAIPMTELSVADRLLLNKRARKALEAEEMGEKQFEDHPEVEAGADESVVGNEGENDVHLRVTKGEGVEDGNGGADEEETVEVVNEAAEEEVAEEEVVDAAEEEEAEEGAAEEEEEGEALELEEFEYKGSTYYRDPENNVYMMDEEGELVDEPIGVWSEVKKRIVVRKST